MGDKRRSEDIKLGALYGADWPNFSGIPRSDPTRGPVFVSHEESLLRELEIINARTVAELGPLPPGGLPVQVKRQPDVSNWLPPTPTKQKTEEEEAMKLSQAAALAVMSAAVMATQVALRVKHSLDFDRPVHEGLPAPSPVPHIVHGLPDYLLSGHLVGAAKSFTSQVPLKDGKLKPNERGMEIRDLQHHLNELGIADAKGRQLDPTGTFDKPTQQAVATFQRQLGLPEKSPVTEHTLNAAEFYAGAPEILRKPLQSALPSELQEMSREPAERLYPGMPPPYRNDWLPRDAEGLPNYLHTHNPAPPATARNSAEHALPGVQAPAPQGHRPQTQRQSDFSHAPHPTAVPTSPVETLPHPLVAETLQLGDRGAAVLALHEHLRLLDVRDRAGRPIDSSRDYSDRTREAVEQFQLWTGREPTGIADPDTLKALQSQAQFAQRQRAQGIVIAAEAHLADHLKPTVPDRADAAIDRPVQGREPIGLLPFSDARHPQHALYADVQQRFQAKGHDLPEEQLSVLAKQMHLGGYKPGWEGDVIVYQGKAVVGAFALGIRQEFVDLNASAPSVQQTMQAFQTDQQSQAEYMERVNQQTMAQGRGRTV